MSEHPSELILQRLGSGETLDDDPARALHLARCHACAETLAGWARLARDLDALDAPDPGPDFAAAVLGRLPETTAEATAGSAIVSLRPWALGLVASSLGAGLLVAFDLDFLLDLPSWIARGLGTAGTTIASALAVADALVAALPEGTSLVLLVVELAFFLGLAFLLKPTFAATDLEEVSR